MGKRKLVKVEPAYSGKYIDYKGSTYQLVQTETSSKYYEGCAFYNKKCDDKLVSYCRQGFIFKKAEF